MAFESYRHNHKEDDGSEKGIHLPLLFERLMVVNAPAHHCLKSTMRPLNESRTSHPASMLKLGNIKTVLPEADS